MREDSSKLNYKWKKGYYNWHYRNTKDHKRLQWIIMGQEIG